MRAIEINEYGGPQVLELVEVAEPEPTDDEVVIDVVSAGINYADTHQPKTDYLVPVQLPFVPGIEAVGHDRDGNRVAALVGQGGYAEVALARPEAVFDLPDEVDDGAALALLLQGLTAFHILRTSARLARGESVVVNAAAGGVGTLAVQIAKLLGAGRVIACASAPEKRQLALDLGADAAIDSTSDDLAAVIREANEGRKADIILEMTGGPVFDANLAALARFGRLVVFGAAGREPALRSHQRA